MIDVTHNVVVPFDAVAAGSWGILNASATAVGPGSDGSAVLTVADWACVQPLRSFSQWAPAFAGGFICPGAAPAYRLEDTAAPGSVGLLRWRYGTRRAITDGASAGFAMYVAGDMFSFEIAAEPRRRRGLSGPCAYTWARSRR